MPRIEDRVRDALLWDNAAYETCGDLAAEVGVIGPLALKHELRDAAGERNDVDGQAAL